MHCRHVGFSVLCLVLSATCSSRRPAFGQFSTYGAWSIGPYQITESQQKGELDEDVLRVYRAGQTNFELRNTGLRINPSEAFPNRRPPRVARPDSEAPEDGVYPYAPVLQRDGQLDSSSLGLEFPAIVVQGYSGGAHCCSTFHVLVFGPVFRAIDPVFAGSVESAEFVANRGTHSLTMEVADPSFEYWEGSCLGDSPFPTIRLRLDLDSNRFLPDPSLMRTAVPNDLELLKRARDAQKEHSARLERREAGVPGALAHEAFSLIYQGHLPVAREFLTNAWAGSVASREKYWTGVLDAIRKLSPYWPAVADVNGIPTSDHERNLRRLFPQEK